VHNIKKNTNPLVVVIKEIGLEEYADKVWRYELCSTVKKANFLRPRGSASCVFYRDTTKPLEQPGKRTRSAARDTTHVHKHTDTTQSLQSLPHVHEMRDTSYSVPHVLVVTVMCELIS
jgi:hypothetical protein